MRILFVTENFPLFSNGEFEITGGVEAVALGMALRLSSNHDVCVVTNYRCSPAVMRIKHLEVVQCGYRGHYRQAGGFISRASFQRQAVACGVKFQPDVVVGWNFVAYPSAYRIAQRCNVPAVAWYADVWVGRWLRLFGLPGLAGEILERRVLRHKWDIFIAISDWTQSRLQRQGIEQERIRVIPPMVNVEEAVSYLAHGEHLEAKRNTTVTVVSRLVDYKRIDVVIRTFKRLAKISDLRLIIIGAGPARKRLQRLAMREGIADRVEWRGWLRKHNEVLSTIASSTVYISASEVEGFGINTIEAAGLGIPYVAADIPAIRFATRGGQGGFLFPPGDVDACATAIEKLLADCTLRENKATEGRNLAQFYRPEIIEPQFEKVLLSVVKEQ